MAFKPFPILINFAAADFNPFPHTKILQQTTLNIFYQKMENLYNWMDNLWLKVENNVAKEEVACFEQLLLLSLCLQKAVYCRGVRKPLYNYFIDLKNIVAKEKFHLVFNSRLLQRHKQVSVSGKRLKEDHFIAVKGEYMGIKWNMDLSLILSHIQQICSRLHFNKCWRKA